ncbi:hypothetical protein D3C83_296310 [compost metagenome]
MSAMAGPALADSSSKFRMNSRLWIAALRSPLSAAARPCVRKTPMWASRARAFNGRTVAA